MTSLGKLFRGDFCLAAPTADRGLAELMRVDPKVKTFTIPHSITSIGDETFKGCTSLAEVTIPDSVSSIGNWAFNVRGALRAKIPNAAPPLILSRFWFYTTRLGDLWPWGVNPALILSDLGSVLVTQVPGYLVQSPSVCLLSKSQHAHRCRC